MRRRRVVAGALAALALALGSAGCTFNKECDGHACIGNWKRDISLGGSVVHCADGKWSHGGGLGDACGAHGGIQ